MKIQSIRDFAKRAITTQSLVFVDQGGVFNQRSVEQAETVQARIKEALFDPSLHRMLVLSLSQKLTLQAVMFDDDTPEARAEVDMFVVSSMKCGYIIAVAEKDFGWGSGESDISPLTETMLAMTAGALVREALRKNHHYLQGQLRVLSLYCGYLFGRFGEKRVSDEINGIETVMRVGPR